MLRVVFEPPPNAGGSDPVQEPTSVITALWRTAPNGIYETICLSGVLRGIPLCTQQLYTPAEKRLSEGHSAHKAVKPREQRKQKISRLPSPELGWSLERKCFLAVSAKVWKCHQRGSAGDPGEVLFGEGVGLP